MDLLRQGFLSSPLLKELEALVRAGDPYPESDAKRHHLVPRFLLQRFVRQTSERPRIMQLDVTCGKPQAVDPAAAASRMRFYRVTDDDGTTHQRVEYFLALVESHAAEAIGRLLERPAGLSPADRATLSVFFGLLESRTSAALANMARIADTLLKYLMASAIAEPTDFAELCRAHLGEADAETIEDHRRRLIGLLRQGKLRLANPHEVAIGLMLDSMVNSAQYIYQLDWCLLQSDEGAFVTSDRALAMHDPTPPYPWSGHGVLSSPSAETTIPLDPGRCLLLTPPQRPMTSTAVSRQGCDAGRVAEINLRTYGFASRYIFGDSQALVAGVRRDAKQRPHLVERPRPFRQVMLIDADLGDERLAHEHRERGWPERLIHHGDLHDYVLLDEEDRVVERSIAVAELGRMRAERRLGSTRLERATVSIHPHEVLPHNTRRERSRASKAS